MKCGATVSKVLVFWLVMSLFLLACAPKATSAPVPKAPLVPAVPEATPATVPKAPPAPAPAAEVPAPRPAPAKPSWDVEWGRLVEAARREGRMDIRAGGASPQCRTYITKSMKEKYGIDVAVTAGKPAELWQKVLTERKVGLFIGDVMLTGTTELVNEAKPRAMLEPLDEVLVLPEVKDAKLWRGYYGPFFDKAHMIAGGFYTVAPIITVNPKLVNPEEIQSFNDLLNPKWKGKISINDPTGGGTGASNLRAILHYMGADFIKKLVGQQEPVVARDKRLQVEWLVKGRYPIGIGTSSSIVAEYQKAGAGDRIADLVTKEGTRDSGGNLFASIVTQAPHPNVARLFVNWILTQEAHATLARLSNHASRRVDVPTDWLPPIYIPQPGVKYLENTEEWKMEEPKESALIEEILKPLLY